MRNHKFCIHIQHALLIFLSGILQSVDEKMRNLNKMYDASLVWWCVYMFVLCLLMGEYRQMEEKTVSGQWADNNAWQLWWRVETLLDFSPYALKFWCFDYYKSNKNPISSKICSHDPNGSLSSFDPIHICRISASFFVPQLWQCPGCTNYARLQALWIITTHFYATNMPWWTCNII